MSRTKKRRSGTEGDRQPPGRGAGRGGTRSGKRSAERWALGPEPFAGATALLDLGAMAGDAPGAARVLARYLAVRLALRAAMGEVDDAMLPLERAAAAEYLAAGPAPRDAEHGALEAVVALAGPQPGPALVSALVEAGRAATDRGHAAGARALLGGAHLIGVGRGFPAEAAAAAAALARLAEAGGDTRAARRWRLRATVLAGVADRAAGADGRSARGRPPVSRPRSPGPGPAAP